MRAPVLLIGFNRPDNMIQVFEQIRKAEPEVLYIAVDGPRESKDGEEKMCEECHSFAQKVDWPCKVHTLFREKNLGCALGVSGAITWAFENEDRLIILEDDCVPQLSFFYFCDEMLERYKDDTRVWQVCGRSYHPDSEFFVASDYIFSRYAHIWGWATWKRCWSHYDMLMSDFPDFRSVGGSLNTSPIKWIGKKENQTYEKIYNEIQKVELYHTWDYQWGFIKNINNGLGIVPRLNMICNIGAVGSHTSNGKPDKLPLGEMPEEIRHPKFVIPNREYEIYHAHHIIFPRVNMLKSVLRKCIRFFFTT